MPVVDAGAPEVAEPEAEVEAEMSMLVRNFALKSWFALKTLTESQMN